MNPFELKEFMTDERPSGILTGTERDDCMASFSDRGSVLKLPLMWEKTSLPISVLSKTRDTPLGLKMSGLMF
ncbi:hypothetical protein [Akkermansia sp. BIOML-A23]|uniref:hypothetical protein n=1 Tax=Akkermansia sp. BIOML-A23 TaxID=2584579 RepID=UPI001F02F9CF|nr:hypothetical protein [Akkermansia sp. BIOML-A23]